jgi:hypothetical protein
MAAVSVVRRGVSRPGDAGTAGKKLRRRPRCGRTCAFGVHDVVHVPLVRLVPSPQHRGTSHTTNPMNIPSIVRFLPATAALAMTAALATAQVPVVVRGEINNGNGGGSGCFWCTGAPFVLKFAGTTVQSSAVNLATFLGQDVVINGTWNGTVLNATSVQLTVDTFSMGGNPSIGQNIRFTSQAPMGTLALNLGALGTQCNVPFADLGMLLAPSSVVALGAGLTNNGNQFRTEFPVPNVPSLIGLRVFGQGVLAPAGSPLIATKLDYVEIQ